MTHQLKDNRLMIWNTSKSVWDLVDVNHKQKDEWESLKNELQK